MKGIKSTIGAAGAVMLAMAGGSAWADSGPGCGLGHQWFAGKTGLGSHVMAATTNGTSAIQAFALTSGTSDCDPNAQVKNDFQRRLFAAANFDDVARDVAHGGGDRLAVLAEMSGVAPADRDAFYRSAQQEFNTLFKAESTSDDMLASLDSLIAGTPVSVR
jgi:hypothetical protein